MIYIYIYIYILPVDLRIPPLELKNRLESSPLKSRFLVCEFAVHGEDPSGVFPNWGLVIR